MPVDLIHPLRLLWRSVPRNVRDSVHYVRLGFPGSHRIKELGSRRDLPHLEALDAVCPKQTPLRNDPVSLRERARRELQRIMSLLGGAGDRPIRMVEVGCGEGAFIQQAIRAGHDAYGIDLAAERFQALGDEDAELRGRLREGSAAAMPFDDATMDLVVSIAALEHYLDIDAFLREAHRVLKPGGSLYVSSGPLWNSAWGGHLYNDIGIPWAHFLYPYDVIEEWYRSHRPGRAMYPLEEIPESRRGVPYGAMNQFSVSHYRQAMAAVPLEIVVAHWATSSYLRRFLENFPELQASTALDELLVDSLTAVLKKPFN